MKTINNTNYPNNIIAAIGYENNLNQDQIDGFYFILNMLREKEQFVLISRYKDSLTLKEIGVKIGVSAERIRQVIYKALRKLRHPSKINYIMFGKTEYEEKLQNFKQIECQTKTNCINFAKEYHEDLKRKESQNDKVLIAKNELLSSSIAILGLSTKSYYALRRYEINTIEELLNEVNKTNWDKNIKNVGKKCKEEIIHTLLENGVIDKYNIFYQKEYMNYCKELSEKKNNYEKIKEMNLEEMSIYLTKIAKNPPKDWMVFLNEKQIL